MPDGGRRVEVSRIDPASCEVLERRTAPIDPYDPEDLARGPGGDLWVADIGDNDRTRDTVAAVVLPATGDPVLHRLTYPDGAHDAEAMVVDAQGRPVIVTKEPAGVAGIYRTDAPPDGAGPTALVRVGEVRLPASDSVGGPLGGFGGAVVTGAGMSVDGRVVALRSYTDAWLYRLPDGSDDVAAALTGTPVRVPLAGEPQGEAVTFEADGTLLSGSERRGAESGQLRAVSGAAALAVSAPAAAPSAPAPAPTDTAPRAALLGGAALVGVLVLAALAMTVHSRRRR